jgi:hypothetical protein
MDRVGHDDNSHQREFITVERFAKNAEENIPGMNRAQQREPSVAGGRNEMQMPAAIASSQLGGDKVKGQKA